MRPLEAEVLSDALSLVAGRGEVYQSPIPEPYTYIPPYQPAVTLADGSITSPFLDMFGRSPRDTGGSSERTVNPTEKQRLYLLNATDVQRKIEGSWRVTKLFRDTRQHPDRRVRWVYLTLLSRYPSDAELETAMSYGAEAGVGGKEALVDLIWALVNSKEFLYRH